VRIDKLDLRIYALDSELDLGPDATGDDLLRAMKGHIVAAGELNGEYAQKRNLL
jgi:phosphatidylethanolamine-binding protein (PEBP) family uncharacterized protein